MDPELDKLNLDGFTQCLSRLPPELRLYIYELSLPCARHRKRKVRLDYIVADAAWMATSPAIFAEASPLLLSRPILLTYTKMNRPEKSENLVAHFDAVIKQTFPQDWWWALELARPMVQRLSIVIRHIDFFQNFVHLPELFAVYFSNMATFTGLKEISISFGPDWVPSEETYYLTSQQIFRPRKISESLADTPRLHPQAQAVRSLKGAFAADCVVKWRFERAGGTPDFPRDVPDREDIVLHLIDVNHYLQVLWTFLCNETDERVDALLTTSSDRSD